MSHAEMASTSLLAAICREPEARFTPVEPSKALIWNAGFLEKALGMSSKLKTTSGEQVH